MRIHSHVLKAVTNLWFGVVHICGLIVLFSFCWISHSCIERQKLRKGRKISKQPWPKNPLLPLRGLLPHCFDSLSDTRQGTGNMEVSGLQVRSLASELTLQWGRRDSIYLQLVSYVFQQIGSECSWLPDTIIDLADTVGSMTDSHATELHSGKGKQTLNE